MRTKFFWFLIVVCYCDIYSIINAYQLALACDPANIGGIEGVKCLGVNLPYSICHLLVVITLIFVLKHKQMRNSVKLVLGIVIGLTIDLFLSSVFILVFYKLILIVFGCVLIYKIVLWARKN